MKKILQTVILVLLPLFTLMIGWELGMRYEQQQLEGRINELESIYKGGNGHIVTDPEKEVDPAILWAVWRMLLKHYIHPEDLQTQELLYGAVQGLVEATGDQYSVFMTPTEHKDFQSALNGKLQGIGAELTLREGLVVIVAPLKGSPAAKAGILPEDIIVEVDGDSTERESLHEVVQRIRGPKGSKVTLGVRRIGEREKLEFTIIRDEIQVPSTEYEVIETGSGSVGYIAINQFAEDTTKEVQTALVEIEAVEDLKGIILDVRFNGGGYLDRAIDIVSMFLQQGKVVSVARKGVEPDAHYVYGRPIDTETPIVVLQNEGSASASEIVAGALQDHGRATVIGKTSFGKGTIQEIFELPGGSSLRITVAKWLTPNGTDLGKHGVDPDIEVDRTPEDYDNEVDPQMEAAVQFLIDGTRPMSPEEFMAENGTGAVVEEE